MRAFVDNFNHRLTIFSIAEYLSDFIRGVDCVIYYHKPSADHLRERDDFFECVFFQLHSLSRYVEVLPSTVNPHPYFKGEEIGDGCFVKESVKKGFAMYCILEVGLNADTNVKGGDDVNEELQKKWDFDLGDGTTLGPRHSSPRPKPEIFKINHADQGTSKCNLEVEVGFREFTSRLGDSIFVIRVKATRDIQSKEEICFDYFAGARLTSGKCYLLDYDRKMKVPRKKVTITEELQTTSAQRSYVVKMASRITDDLGKWCDQIGYKAIRNREVYGVFKNGEFLNDEIVERGCKFMQHVAKAEDIFIANPMYATLLTQNTFARILHVDEKQVKNFIEKYPSGSWATPLNQKKKVYIPINYPFGAHWVGVLLFREDAHYYVRVYNSMQDVDDVINDRELANTVCQVMAIMDPLYEEVQWRYERPVDNLKQRTGLMRCGMHVITRAWQICRNEHLTRVMAWKQFHAIVMFVKLSLLNYAKICEDGLIPRYGHL